MTISPLLARFSQSNVSRWIEDDGIWRRLSYALIIMVGLIMLVTFRDYGITGDEPFHVTHGKAVIAWYASFFQDRSAADMGVFNDMVFYGRFFEVVALLADKVLPFGFYENLHVIACLFGLTGIAAAYKLGSHLLNPMAGFFSALFLTLTPMLYGQSFNNPKDPPLATLYVVSLYLIVVSYDQMPRLPKRLLAKIGLSIGLALGVRPGAMILFGCAAVCWIAWYIAQLRLKAFSTLKEARNTAAVILGSFIVVLTIGWVVMLIWLPWAQLSPLKNPFRIMAWFAGSWGGGGGFVFKGQELTVGVPWHYLLTWLSIQLPEFYLVSLIIGCPLVGGFILKHQRDGADSRKPIKLAILGLGILFPVTSAIVLHSPLYNAMRHFLFILPPLAVLVGVSFSTLLRSRIHRGVKVGISVLIAISAGLTVIDMIQLHPYQYIYFNRLIAGGLKGADRKFETEYWGTSYKEAAQWLIDNYHPDCHEVIRVNACGAEFPSGYYFDKSIEAKDRFMLVAGERDDDGWLVEGLEPPHVLLSTTRETCYRTGQGKVLHIVERQGVPLRYIIELHRPR